MTQADRPLPDAFYALKIDPDSIADENLRRCIIGLLNIIQELATSNAQLKEANAQLRDEIARQKGESGRPNIKPNKGGGADKRVYSSEKQRKVGQQSKKHKRSKKRIVVDRYVHCPVDRKSLPEDAEYKGIVTKIIQNLIFRRDNVAYGREKYYSSSESKTYLGALPFGCDSRSFAPELRSFVMIMYYAIGTSEPKIRELLAHVDIEISAGEVSNLLIGDVELFHEEQSEAHVAGVASTPWQQTDDTSTRVNGKNQYCHVLGNPLYTTFRTMPRKDRPSVLAVMRGSDTPRYLVDEEMRQQALKLKVPGAVVDVFCERMAVDEEMDEAAFMEAYQASELSVGASTRRKLFEAAAVAAYKAQTDVAVVRTLLGDDARQFDDITDERALCWVHEGRHYAKLVPMVPHFEHELQAFLARFWSLYRELLAYRQAQSVEEAERLRKDFDELFTTKVSYTELSERIEKTRAKKAELLLVLEHPELPLHNNDMELAARQRVRKRDVSFGPRTKKGSRAWDTLQSIIATLKKLDVNVYDYFVDRVCALGRIAPLATMIRERARTAELGASWELPVPAG